MLKAVIFDMDGVIIDSHSVAYQLLCQAANSLGCNLTVEEIKSWGSLSSRQFWQRVKGTYNLPQELSDLIRRYDRDKEIGLYKNMEPISGVIDLINDLRNNKIKTALATSASSERMHAVLKIFDLQEIFDVCVCDEDVSRSKPAPEIFLRAASELRENKANCLVIEDSQNGILAAKKADMKCLGFCGSKYIKEDLRKADLIIDDFKKLSADDLDNIF